MNVRPLRDGEQGALLDLAGLWPAQDDWPMRALFARYVEDDPRFDPRDVWVAEEDGALRACVQIFPRTLRLRGRSVPVGGIGTVFTHPERRGHGLAGAVMRAAMADLRGRGMELGLLFAGPVPFYEGLGWHAWPVKRPLLRPPEGAAAGARAAAEAFLPARDLAEVQALHGRYSEARDGTCLRSHLDWRTSLRHAGNPAEDFLVARREGRVRAYVRAACLSRFLVVTEWGREPDAAGALADLFLAVLAPREDDPLAPRARPSPEFRSVATAAPLLDPGLERALAERGVTRAEAEDGGSMFWLARPEALARRFAEPWRPRDTGDLELPGQREAALLRRILPPERFAFWVADRF